MKGKHTRTRAHCFFPISHGVTVTVRRAAAAAFCCQSQMCAEDQNMALSFSTNGRARSNRSQLTSPQWRERAWKTVERSRKQRARAPPFGFCSFAGTGPSLWGTRHSDTGPTVTETPRRTVPTPGALSRVKVSACVRSSTGRRCPCRGGQLTEDGTGQHSSVQPQLTVMDVVVSRSGEAGPAGAGRHQPE